MLEVQWKYKILTKASITVHYLEMELEKLGQDGWELCGVIRDNFIFKKPAAINPDSLNDFADLIVGTLKEHLDLNAIKKLKEREVRYGGTQDKMKTLDTKQATRNG